MVFRTEAKLMAHVEKLEAVRVAAREFLYALRTDPGYPMKLEDALRKAIADSEVEP